MENYLTNHELPAVPDREALRALYDEAADVISAKNNLNTPWHRKIRDAVFEACYAALCDHHSGKRRMLTVAAPPGAGKTSFSMAFIVAFTRYAEQHPGAAYGVVFLTDRSARAAEVYRELDALLPGARVAF
jgi:superfamily II DNA or RNA helicase